MASHAYSRETRQIFVGNPEIYLQLRQNIIEATSQNHPESGPKQRKLSQPFSDDFMLSLFHEPGVSGFAWFCDIEVPRGFGLRLSLCRFRLKDAVAPGRI